MLELVKKWIETNPSRDSHVFPIEIRIQSDTSEEIQIVNGPGGTSATPLDPPGPVSLYLWYTDPLYRVGTLKLRIQILREALTDLAKRIEEECRGPRWQRKKILDQLAGQQSAAVSPQQDTHELDEALCYVLGFQKLILDDIHKRVLHFPKDFRTWSEERPVWTTGLGSRCIYHLPGEKTLAKGLGIWLGLRESEGWKITWPVSEGKLDDIKAKCVAKNVKPAGAKPLKEDWAITLGKHEGMDVLLRQFSP